MNLNVPRCVHLACFNVLLQRNRKPFLKRAVAECQCMSISRALFFVVRAKIFQILNLNLRTLYFRGDSIFMAPPSKLKPPTAKRPLVTKQLQQQQSLPHDQQQSKQKTRKAQSEIETSMPSELRLLVRALQCKENNLALFPLVEDPTVSSEQIGRKNANSTCRFSHLNASNSYG